MEKMTSLLRLRMSAKVVCRAHGTCVTPKDCQRLEIKK